jgi:hypothetical protein
MVVWLFALLIAGLLYAVNVLSRSDTLVFQNRGITLCYPADYDPEPGPVVSKTIGAVESQLDVSQGERLLYLPSSLFGEAISGYVETYTAMLNPAAGQEMMGILYPLEAPPTLHPFFQDAWHGIGDFKDPYVEEDENGLYRIYLHPALRGSKGDPWLMIESPPQRASTPEPPKGWAVGYCSYIYGGPGTYDCKLTFNYKDRFQYRFRLHEQNMHLRNEVKSYLEMLFQKWEKNCSSDSV